MINIFFIVICFVLTSCNYPSEVERKYIELAYCLNIDINECTDIQIRGYMDFFAAKEVSIDTEKSATINNLCRLINRYDILENRQLLIKNRLLAKVETKINSTKYNYFAYNDCSDLFELKYINPLSESRDIK